MDEIRRRLTAVETEQAAIREQSRQAQRVVDLYPALEQDVTDLRVTFGQQRQALSAIGRVQSEHTAMLMRHGDVAAGGVLEMGTIRRTQNEHGDLLREVLARLPARDG
jgi:hypothetical protein